MINIIHPFRYKLKIYQPKKFPYFFLEDQINLKNFWPKKTSQHDKKTKI